jgi:hypothetical protein
MIGESILSLLIIKTTKSSEYYIIASLGTLTVIVIQALKFESEPSHAEGHALWRSTEATMIFSLLIQLLSIGLIAFGVSYKVMLSKAHLESMTQTEADGSSFIGGCSSCNRPGHCCSTFLRFLEDCIGGTRIYGKYSQRMETQLQIFLLGLQF